MENNQPEIQVRPEKVLETMKAFGALLQTLGVTGNEYITVLHNCVAQVLCENPKKLERDFLTNIRVDVLKRRLRKLKEEAGTNQ